jgi:hypothetical protein
VAKEVGSGGQCVGPKAPEPPEAAESFVFLCHVPNMTLSEEQLAGARLGSDARKPLGIGSLGLVSYAWALADIVSRAGAKGRARRCRRSGAQGSRKPLEPQAEAAVESGSAGSLC